MSERVLYDLVASQPGQRFSPFCFRVKLALAHKDLDYRSELVRFTEKPKIAFSNQPLVPVLVEADGTVISDSFRIMQELETRYPHAPLITPGDRSLGFVRAWTDRSLLFAVFKVVAPKIHDVLEGADKAYFQSSREQRLGTTLAALAEDEGKYRAVLNTTVEPLRGLLAAQPCVSGEQVGAADALVLACVLWAEGVLAGPVFPADDPISAWRERMAPWVDQTLAMAGQPDPCAAA